MKIFAILIPPLQLVGYVALRLPLPEQAGGAWDTPETCHWNKLDALSKKYILNIFSQTDLY